MNTQCKTQYFAKNKTKTEDSFGAQQMKCTMRLYPTKQGTLHRIILSYFRLAFQTPKDLFIQTFGPPINEGMAHPDRQLLSISTEYFHEVLPQAAGTMRNDNIFEPCYGCKHMGRPFVNRN